MRTLYYMPEIVDYIPDEGVTAPLINYEPTDEPRRGMIGRPIFQRWTSPLSRLLNNVRSRRMMTAVYTQPPPQTTTAPTPPTPPPQPQTTTVPTQPTPPTPPPQPQPQIPPYDPYSPDSIGWLYQSVVSQYPPELSQSFPPVWQGGNQYTPPASQGGYQYTPPPTYYQPEGQVRLIKPVDRIPLDKIDWRITTPPDRRITTLPVLTTTPDEEKRKKQFYDREYGYYYDPAGYGSGIERD